MRLESERKDLIQQVRRHEDFKSQLPGEARNATPLQIIPPSSIQSLVTSIAVTEATGQIDLMRRQCKSILMPGATDNYGHDFYRGGISLLMEKAGAKLQSQKEHDKSCNRWLATNDLNIDNFDSCNGVDNFGYSTNYCASHSLDWGCG